MYEAVPTSVDNTATAGGAGPSGLTFGTNGGYGGTGAEQLAAVSMSVTDIEGSDIPADLVL